PPPPYTLSLHDALPIFLAQQHQRMGLGLVGTRNAHHLNGIVSHQAVLDRCRGNVLAFAGFEDLLDAAGQLETTHFVDLALVTGLDRKSTRLNSSHVKIS